MTNNELAEFFRAARASGRVERITLSPSQYAQFLKQLDAPLPEQAQQRLQELLAREAPWE